VEIIGVLFHGEVNPKQAQEKVKNGKEREKKVSWDDPFILKDGRISDIIS